MLGHLPHLGVDRPRWTSAGDPNRPPFHRRWGCFIVGTECIRPGYAVVPGFLDETWEASRTWDRQQDVL